MSILSDIFGIGSVLDALLCLLEKFVTYVLIGIMKAVNLIILGLADALAALVALLPGMPGFPTLSLNVGWLNYFVPVSGFASLLATVVSLVLTIYVVRVALRWVKAL